MHFISSCDSGLSEIIFNHFLHKMPPKLTSEHVICKNFLGGMPPDPPSFSMLRMLVVLRTTYVDNAILASYFCGYAGN